MLVYQCTCADMLTDLNYVQPYMYISMRHTLLVGGVISTHSVFFLRGSPTSISTVVIV